MVLTSQLSESRECQISFKPILNNSSKCLRMKLLVRMLKTKKTSLMINQKMAIMPLIMRSKKRRTRLLLLLLSKRLLNKLLLMLKRLSPARKAQADLAGASLPSAYRNIRGSDCVSSRHVWDLSTAWRVRCREPIRRRRSADSGWSSWASEGHERGALRCPQELHPQGLLQPFCATSRDGLNCRAPHGPRPVVTFMDQEPRDSLVDCGRRDLWNGVRHDMLHAVAPPACCERLLPNHLYTL